MYLQLTYGLTKWEAEVQHIHYASTKCKKLVISLCGNFVCTDDWKYLAK